MYFEISQSQNKNKNPGTFWKPLDFTSTREIDKLFKNYISYLINYMSYNKPYALSEDEKCFNASCNNLLGVFALITAPIVMPIAGFMYLVNETHIWLATKKMIRLRSKLSYILDLPIPEWCCDDIVFGWTHVHVTTIMVSSNANSNTAASFIQSHWLPERSFFIVQIDKLDNVTDLVNIAQAMRGVEDERTNIIRVFNYSSRPSISVANMAVSMANGYYGVLGKVLKCV
jgi:hypothetical protein